MKSKVLIFFAEKKCEKLLHSSKSFFYIFFSANKGQGFDV